MMLPLLAEMTGSIHVGLAAMGVGIGIGLTGLGMATAVGRNPGAFTPILVHGILAGTQSGRQVVAQFAPAVAHRLEALVRNAFITGLHTAFRMDAALAFGGLLVAVAFVGGVAKHDQLHLLRRWHHHASTPATVKTAGTK